MELYNKGVKQLDAGKGDDARKSFETIMKDYPTSAYAKLAKEGLDKPLVGSITFVDTKPLSDKEVRKQYELAGARLMVGRPYNRRRWRSGAHAARANDVEDENEGQRHHRHRQRSSGPQSGRDHHRRTLIGFRGE